jgi:hypothetical protein
MQDAGAGGGKEMTSGARKEGGVSFCSVYLLRAPRCSYAKGQPTKPRECASPRHACAC